jgi:glycerol-3-phosphate dehydrogenase
MELSRHDLVVFAVPAASLPAAVAAHGPQVPARAGVLVSSKGLVPPLGSRPAAYVSERVNAWAVAALAGPSHAAAALEDGASLVLAATDPAFARQVAGALTAAGFDCVGTRDVIGVELAGTAKNAAALAAAAASHAGPNASGAAAGKVFAEVDAYARSEGSLPGTFAGLAGAGDLVATVLADGSRNRRAGVMLGNGVPASAISPALGQAAEAMDSIPLLVACMHRAGVEAPATAGLADLIEGRLGAEQWAASLTEPAQRTPKARVA